MARGNNAREGRAARSELSDRLRAKAEVLREENAKEQKSADAVEQEYQDALEVAYMRAEEETRDDFKGRKREVDADEQQRRENEAKENERLALEDAEREKQVLQDTRFKRQSLEQGMTKDLFDVPHTTKPQAWTQEFMDKWNDSAPDQIKNALATYFENTVNDRMGIKEALNMAYIEAAGVPVEKQIYQIQEKPDLEKAVSRGVPSKEQHEAGLKNMERFKKFFKKMVKSSTELDNLFDKDGKMRDY
jgi:hypothetical protein